MFFHELSISFFFYYVYVLLFFFLLSYYAFCKFVISPDVIMRRDILISTYSGIDIDYVHNNDIITK